MKKNFQLHFLLLPLLLVAALALGCARDDSAAKIPGGPQLGQKAAGPVLDKSGDAELAELIRTVAPRFSQHEFSANGATMKYSLFTPEKIKKGKKYPMLLFMADASTVGDDAQTPLTQGYGALLFATAQAQAKNPCYVLVPQFSGVAVNDAYEHTPEADMIPALIKELEASGAVDPARVYVTGQSMGGMLGMYYLAGWPDMFAAGLFVDSHWNPASMDKLVEKPFIFVYAGNAGKAWKCEQAIEEACRKMSKSYAWAEWSARLPQDTQDALADNVLGKGNPVNLVGFENGTVLPENVKGSEHMYSFDKAYQLTPLRDWLFGQKLK